MKAIIVKLKDIKEHPNADNVKLTNVFGNQIVIGKNYKEGDTGVFFEVETQLSKDFCKFNNLYSDSKKNFDTDKKGYFGDNRKVRAQNFRGEKSEGYFVPLSYLNYLFNESNEDPVNDALIFLIEGTEFDELYGEKICSKYVNPNYKKECIVGSKKKDLGQLLPNFREHFDTKQFYKEFHKVINKNEQLLFYITEKLHGTSARVGNTVVINKPKWWEFWKSSKKEYKNVVGSRKVIKSIGDVAINGNGYYGDFDIWTDSANMFKNKLRQGETVYYEIVGFLNEDKSIMGEYSNEKLKPLLSKENYEEVIKEYGEKTIFSYNSIPGKYRIFVYRISMTSPDGIEYDLTWQQVKDRCKSLGVDYVPELYTGLVGDIKYLSDLVSHFTEIASTNFKEHIKEGICVRIETADKQPIILKNKSFVFKVLEGIITDEVADIEEQQK